MWRIPWPPTREAFTVQLQTSNPEPWWVTSIVLPSVFLLLGALIGFAGTWVRDQLEARRARRAFLRAIRRELASLEGQIEQAIAELEDSMRKMEGSRHVPQFTLGFRTTVYTSQLGKLRDIADPLLLEIVEVYSDISSLTGVVDLLNQHSVEALKLRPPQTLSIFAHSKNLDTHIFLEALALVGSACRVLVERLRPLSSKVQALMARLPA